MTIEKITKKEFTFYSVGVNDDNYYVKEEEENDKSRNSDELLDVKPLLPLYKRHPFTYSENGKYPYI